MNKLKFRKTLALIVVFMFVFTSVAAAAVPSNTIIVGENAVNIDQFMADPTAALALLQADIEAELPVYVYTEGAKIFDVFTNNEVTQQAIDAQVKYLYDAEGNKTTVGGVDVAEAAVVAYEAAPITTLAEITTAEGLKAPADAAVAAVTTIATKEAFTARITTKTTAIATKKVELTVLAVTSVSAINAKQIVVKFNKAVQAGVATGGAEVLTNYKLGSANPTRVTLNAAKTEATITFGTAGFVADLDKYVQFEVTGIKDASGKDVTDYKAPLLLEDKSKPVLATKFVAPNTVVEFSEPVQVTAGALTGATVAVDGVTNTPYTVTNDSLVDTLVGASKITIPGLSAGTHRIDVIGAKDLAGNVLPEYTATVTVGSDSTAPTVTSVTSEGNKVKVKFSEAVVNATLNAQATKRVWLTVDGVDVYLTSTDQTDDNGLEYEYDATSSIISGDFKNVSVSVKGAVDASGNALAAATPAQTVLVTKDTTKPTVVGTTIKDDKIIIKMSESIVVGFTPFTTINGTYTTTDGVRNTLAANTATAAYVYDANNDGDTTDAGEDKYVVLTVTDASLLSSAKLKGGTYTINLGAQFVKDTAAIANEAAATTLSFTVASDSATSAVVTATPSQVSTGLLQFAFNNVLTNAALDINKYTINGQPLPVGTELYFFGDKKTVRAQLPAGYIFVTGFRTVAVKDIVDENGNTLTTAAKNGLSISITENTKPVAQSVTLVDDKVLNVEMSEALADPAAATGIEVYVNGVKVDTTANTLAFTKGNGTNGTDTRLTITATNSVFAPSQTIVVKFVEGSTLADVAGNKVTVGQVQK